MGEKERDRLLADIASLVERKGVKPRAISFAGIELKELLIIGGLIFGAIYGYAELVTGTENSIGQLLSSNKALTEKIAKLEVSLKETNQHVRALEISFARAGVK